MKQLKGFLLGIAAVCCAVGFAACGGDSGAGKTGENKIVFKTLTVDGTKVSGVVSNATEDFSFMDEIETSGKVKYTVSTDKYGEDIAFSKIVPLHTGDNKIYIFETIDDEITETYVVTIRRRPLYEVVFTLNGKPVHTQSVEEGSFAEEPASVEVVLGYSNFAWDFDFSQPITELTYIAVDADVLPEMSNFEFTSTATTCVITGLKNKEITQVTIPDYVTEIGDNAFLQNHHLTNVKIGENVKKIGYRAFANCYNLSKIVIPDGVEILQNSAFNACSNLASVTIGSGLRSIEGWTFAECCNLTEITIPIGVTEIWDGTFYGCDALTIYCEAVSAPSGWIDTWADSYAGSTPVVWDCKNNDVANDGYIYTVADGLRYGIKDGEATLVNQAKGLTVANISSAIVCKGRTYSVTEISLEAFYNCNALTDVRIPTSVEIIGSDAFTGCYSLLKINYSGTRDQFYSVKNKSSYWSWASSVDTDWVSCIDGAVAL